jgi:ubiquitin domain-containing protein
VRCLVSYHGSHLTAYSPRFRKNIRVSHKTGTEILHSDDDEDGLAHIHSEDDDTEDDASDHDDHDDEDDEDEDDDHDDETEDWVEVPDPQAVRSRDPDPDESASRSRRPIASSARSYNYPRPAARRSQSARKPAYPEVVEPPSAPPPARRGGKDRLHRAKTTAPSTMSGEDDDYIYPHGMHPYPMEWGRGFGGPYPGSARGGGWDNPYTDQFLDANQSPNPFAMGPGSDYFARRGNRMSMPIRPGNELMALGPQFGYGMPPGFPYGYPPITHQSPSPHNSKKSTPPPTEEKPAPTDPRVDAIHALLMDSKKREDDRQRAELARRIEEERRSKERALKEEEDKLKRLEILIMKHNADQIEREKKQEALRQAEEIAKKEAELHALEQKKIADEKAKEVKAAAELAKLEAEKEAAKKAAEEKEKHEKELEELKKKAAEVEAAKKKFEEEAKKLRPGDDMLKPPIRFKDAVGRKFSFPWHICKTWKVI